MGISFPRHVAAQVNETDAARLRRLLHLWRKWGVFPLAQLEAMEQHIRLYFTAAATQARQGAGAGAGAPMAAKRPPASEAVPAAAAAGPARPHAPPARDLGPSAAEMIVLARVLRRLQDSEGIDQASQLSVQDVRAHNPVFFKQLRQMAAEEAAAAMPPRVPPSADVVVVLARTHLATCARPTGRRHRRGAALLATLTPLWRPLRGGGRRAGAMKTWSTACVAPFPSPASAAASAPSRSWTRSSGSDSGECCSAGAPGGGAPSQRCAERQGLNIPEPSPRPPPLTQRPHTHAAARFAHRSGGWRSRTKRGKGRGVPGLGRGSHHLPARRCRVRVTPRRAAGGGGGEALADAAAVAADR